MNKATIGLGALAGLSRLVGEAANGAGGIEIPGLGAMANLTATGAMIYLAIWLTTKSIPAMQLKASDSIDRLMKDFREENLALRLERDKERERVVCAAHTLRDLPK